MAIFTGVLWIVCTIFVPETYAPVLLRKRAAKLSKQTGKVYISKLDFGKPHKTVAAQFKVALSRPWILLFKEPIVLLTSIYMAIVYGTLYIVRKFETGISLAGLKPVSTLSGNRTDLCGAVFRCLPYCFPTRPRMEPRHWRPGFPRCCDWHALGCRVRHV